MRWPTPTKFLAPEPDYETQDWDEWWALPALPLNDGAAEYDEHTVPSYNEEGYYE